MTDTQTEAELRRALVTACRILGTSGHEDTIFGHASVRVGSDRYLLKGGGIGLAEVGDDDLVEVTLDGGALSGARPVHNEHPIHGEIYRARPDVRAIVHTHPPNAAAFSALDEPLRPVTHDASLFCPPGVPRFVRTSALIRTQELGAALATELGAAEAVLVRNHGLVTASSSIGRAVVAALCLERACEAQLRLGPRTQGVDSSSDEESLEKRDIIWGPGSIEAQWSYLIRQLPHAE